jgi:hypothetical protein
LFIINSNELNYKDQKKKKTKPAVTITIKESNDIVAITFFKAKPPKKAQVAIIFCSKAIEEGDKSCRLLLLRYNEIIKEDNDSLSSPPML